MFFFFKIYTMQRSDVNLMAMLKMPYVFFKDLLRIGNPGLTNGNLLKKDELRLFKSCILMTMIRSGQMNFLAKYCLLQPYIFGRCLDLGNKLISALVNL